MRTRQARARGVLLAAIACVAQAAAAQGFADAWERALATEPALQAARANRTAAEERTIGARAALLPQIDANANRNLNRRTFVQNTQNPFTGEPSPETGERYYATTAQVNLTQPLWRPQNWAALAQARESEQQAYWEALATEQDLHGKFVTAWFDVMAARDSVVNAGEQVEATRQQREVMQRGLALGTHSEVQAAEAVARHEQALADRAGAQTELEAKTAVLEQLTGPLPAFHVPQWRSGDAAFLFAPLAPLPEWLARVESDSPAVRAAQRAVAAAREEVRKQQALHQPTVDFVSRHARIDQGSGTSPGQPGYRSREHSWGLQLNVPIYSGGGNSARAREAAAMAMKAEADLEGARRNALTQARQAWATAQAAQAKSQAAEHALRAAEVALRAATTGQGTGLKTVLDELQAREQLAHARRDQQRAHYDRVVGLARLRAAAGEPADAFIAAIAVLLGPASSAPAR
ncbi:TolC family outer membrane protein [Ramlibacter sp. USB13]|uniref:TolC family outer membrane protein n=1 Tax=Ramlibacter cellulosilyticus TaxID=2764187 RepID=A0A923SAN5_9BURK|nr:TolC family outer membrane protein [Ramlibacter cellulosilyticus]